MFHNNFTQIRRAKLKENEIFFDNLKHELQVEAYNKIARAFKRWKLRRDALRELQESREKKKRPKATRPKNRQTGGSYNQRA